VTHRSGAGGGLPRPTLVIGVGNRHRHDDAVGLDTVERLRARLSPGVRVVAFEGESTGLLDLWSGAGLVVLVDAIAPNGRPGTVHRCEGDLAPFLSAPSPTSTHGLSVGEAWRLGELLGQRPDRLVVFGVEGAEFTPGVGLSPAVAASVDPVVEAVVREVAAGTRTTGDSGAWTDA
jgi:hydrogenase maturation protease